MKSKEALRRVFGSGFKVTLRVLAQTLDHAATYPFAKVQRNNAPTEQHQHAHNRPYRIFALPSQCKIHLQTASIPIPAT